MGLGGLIALTVVLWIIAFFLLGIFSIQEYIPFLIVAFIIYLMIRSLINQWKK